MGIDVIQRQFKFMIDTGSRITWVYQAKCKNCTEANKGILTRKCEGDSCLPAQGQQQSIYYGLGYASYYSTIDFLRIADMINDQNIILAVGLGHVTDINRENKSQFNGLIGLAPGTDFNPNQFINQFIKNKHVNQNIFSINFRKEDPSLVIGGIREDLVPKDTVIPFIPVDKDEDQWRVKLQDIKLGGLHSILWDNIKNPYLTSVNEQENEITQIFDNNESKINARIDSGANMIVVEMELGERIRDIIQQEYNMKCKIKELTAGAYYSILCDCEEGKLKKLPPISFHFLNTDDQEIEYTLKPNQYFTVDMNRSYKCVSKVFVQPKISEKQKQYDLQQEQENHQYNRPYLFNEIILGQPFLYGKLGVFDKENGEIGLLELEPFNTKIIQVAIFKFIAIGILVVLICFFAAQKIIQLLN